MDLTTRQEFLSASLKEGNAELSAVLFYSAEQPQSKQMSSVLEMLKSEFPFNYYKVQLDKNVAETVAAWAPIAISAAPLVVLFKSGNEVARIEGAEPPRLVTLIKQFCSSDQSTHAEGGNKVDSRVQNGLSTAAETPVVAATAVEMSTYPQPATAASDDDQRQRLQSLVNSAPVVIFMKGSECQPLCHFSQQAAEMLRTLHVEIKSFDVLTDPSLREGMKKFSNWPTFPQLYVKGEFVGGVDIMRDMLNSGDLYRLVQPLGAADIKYHIRALTRMRPMMVFMKGERQQPFCRFSRQLMELFGTAGVEDFGTFDVMRNDDVREGLKKLFDWPTYPQVYVNGRLLGGVDVVKSIIEEKGNEGLREAINEMMDAA